MTKARVRHDLSRRYKTDVQVRDDNGELIGTMGINRDGLQWWPRNYGNPYIVSWEEFQEWVEDRER